MLEINFAPFPVLQTERLMLRQIASTDAPALFDLRTNPDAMKYIGRPIPKSIDEVNELITKMMDVSERIQWAICINPRSQLIGTIGYHIIQKEHHRAEIGYMLHPAFWGKGIMNEAIASVVNFGFDAMNLHSIEARIDPANIKSAGILKKQEFIKEGYFKESYYYNGIYVDSEIYSLLAGDRKQKLL